VTKASPKLKLIFGGREPGQLSTAVSSRRHEFARTRSI
jgi:hypothetical protein